MKYRQYLESAISGHSGIISNVPYLLKGEYEVYCFRWRSSRRQFETSRRLEMTNPDIGQHCRK
jgi:hypothetical protein